MWTSQSNVSRSQANNAMVTRRGLAAILALYVCSAAFAADNRWVGVKGDWEPAPTVLAELKARLEPFAKKAAQEQGRKLRNWEEYVFQYQGQKTAGRRYILVNGLCHVFPKTDLTNEIVLVFDGGSCYFNVKYDPEQHKYYELLINGDA